MLERPDIQDARIIACLQDDYGVRVVQLAFLPLGADLNTAVYCVAADDGTPYFLKLRRGIFDESLWRCPSFSATKALRKSYLPLQPERDSSGQPWIPSQ